MKNQNILFSTLLAEESPSHRTEQVMCISEFSCGCMTTITYAGTLGETKALSPTNGTLWSDSSACTKGHEIDWSEFEKLQGLPKVDIVTEIYASSSMDVSFAAGSGKCPMKFKKGDLIRNENSDTFKVTKVDYPFYEIEIDGNREVGNYSSSVRRLSMAYTEKSFCHNLKERFDGAGNIYQHDSKGYGW